MKYSIIGNGLVGQTIQAQSCGAKIYNRHQHDSFLEKKHNVIVVAAPSSNRLTVGQYSSIDEINCGSIVQTLNQADYQHIVYISTVDVYANRKSNNADPSKVIPESAYGRNRQWLENNIAKMNNSHIIRLPSLISPNLTKNVLYDLKYQQWLGSINLDSSLQWYSLNNIMTDIMQAIDNNQMYTNLVSAPISNRDIVSLYYPELLLTLESNVVPQVQYDVKNHNGEYSVNNDIIWQSFTEFFS